MLLIAPPRRPAQQHRVHSAYRSRLQVLVSLHSLTIAQYPHTSQAQGTKLFPRPQNQRHPQQLLPTLVTPSHKPSLPSFLTSSTRSSRRSCRVSWPSRPSLRHSLRWQARSHTPLLHPDSPLSAYRSQTVLSQRWNARPTSYTNTR